MSDTLDQDGNLTDVGEFRCHMCHSGDVPRLGPATVKIGSLLNVSVYLCFDCQVQLRDVMKKYIRKIPTRPDKDPGRNIIV